MRVVSLCCSLSSQTAGTVHKRSCCEVPPDFWPWASSPLLVVSLHPHSCPRWSQERGGLYFTNNHWQLQVQLTDRLVCTCKYKAANVMHQQQYMSNSTVSEPFIHKYPNSPQVVAFMSAFLQQLNVNKRSPSDNMETQETRMCN